MIFTANQNLIRCTILQCELIRLNIVVRLSFPVLPEIKDVIFEPRHEISNNVVCATSKGSGKPVHTRSLIRTFASGLNNLPLLSY